MSRQECGAAMGQSGPSIEAQRKGVEKVASALVAQPGWQEIALLAKQYCDPCTQLSSGVQYPLQLSCTFNPDKPAIASQS